MRTRCALVVGLLFIAGIVLSLINHSDLPEPAQWLASGGVLVAATWPLIAMVWRADQADAEAARQEADLRAAVNRAFETPIEQLDEVGRLAELMADYEANSTDHDVIASYRPRAALFLGGDFATGRRRLAAVPPVD